MPYHSAKGLTFDTVLMPRLVKSSFPVLSAARINHLLFVAITRATKWLYLSTLKGKEVDSLQLVRNLGEKGLKNMKDKNSRWLPDFKAALNKVVPDIKDFQVQKIGGYLVIKLLHSYEKGEHWFDASQESDGTLRVLGLLAALYQDSPPTLLAIEEPELTIYPGALAVLADVMKEAAGRTQLLLTTHSPDLISRLPVDALRAVEKLDGVTLISDIDETKRMDGLRYGP